MWSFMEDISDTLEFLLLPLQLINHLSSGLSREVSRTMLLIFRKISIEMLLRIARRQKTKVWRDIWTVKRSSSPWWKKEFAWSPWTTGTLSGGSKLRIIYEYAWLQGPVTTYILSVFMVMIDTNETGLCPWEFVACGFALIRGRPGRPFCGSQRLKSTFMSGLDRFDRGIPESNLGNVHILRPREDFWPSGLGNSNSERHM